MLALHAIHRLYCCTQALAEIVGFEIKRDEVTSLKRLLDHDIAIHLAKITETSDQASRYVHLPNLCFLSIDNSR